MKPTAQPTTRLAITIITVCMNRRDHILETLPRVCAWPHHQEHILVDWSSRSPLERNELPGDPRIRLLRVEGETYWNPSQAYNFAAAHVRTEWIFRLDADCWVQDLDPSALMLTQPADGWVARSSQAGGVGELLVRTKLFWGIGGFHELMRGYGFEDKDLLYRLESQPGVQLGSLAPQHVLCIAHTARVRASVHGSESMARALKRATSMSNRFLAASCPWPGHHQHCSYHETGRASWRLNPGSLPQPPEDIAAEALRLRRTIFWGYFLLLPELYVIRAPQALLPTERNGRFPIHWAHYLYWHSVRRLVALPLLIIEILQSILRWLPGRSGS